MLPVANSILGDAFVWCVCIISWVKHDDVSTWLEDSNSKRWLFVVSITFVVITWVLAMFVQYWKSALRISLSLLSFCIIFCSFISNKIKEMKSRILLVVSMVSFHACRQAMVVFLQQKYWKPTYSRDVQCLRDVYSTQESSFSFHPIVERISEYLQYIAYIGSDWFSGLYENAAPHFSGSAVFVQMCYKDIKGFLFLFILCLLPSYSSGIMLRHGLILRVVNSITAGGLPPWFFFQSLFFLGGGVEERTVL